MISKRKAVSLCRIASIVLSKRRPASKQCYAIALGAEGARQDSSVSEPGVQPYVRRIWADIDVGPANAAERGLPDRFRQRTSETVLAPRFEGRRWKKFRSTAIVLETSSHPCGITRLEPTRDVGEHARRLMFGSHGDLGLSA